MNGSAEHRALAAGAGVSERPRGDLAGDLAALSAPVGGRQVQVGFKD